MKYFIVKITVKRVKFQSMQFKGIVIAPNFAEAKRCAEENLINDLEKQKAFNREEDVVKILLCSEITSDFVYSMVEIKKK